MDKRQLGGAILAGTSGAAYAILPMTWPHPTHAQLIGAWIILGLAFMTGIFLVFSRRTGRFLGAFRKIGRTSDQIGVMLDGQGATLEGANIADCDTGVLARGSGHTIKNVVIRGGGTGVKVRPPGWVPDDDKDD